MTTRIEEIKKEFTEDSIIDARDTEYLLDRLESARRVLEKISVRCWNPGPDANSTKCKCNGCLARDWLAIDEVSSDKNQEINEHA